MPENSQAPLNIVGSTLKNCLQGHYQLRRPIRIVAGRILKIGTIEGRRKSVPLLIRCVRAAA